MNRKKLSMIGVGLASLLVFTGCAGDSGNGGSPEEPTEGGTLRVGIDNDQGCLDPAAIDIRVSLQWSRQIADSLVFMDQEGIAHPWLAEDYSINDDASEYTFNLRDDVVFSDGTELNAEVVQQNFDRLKELGGDAFAAQTYLETYEGVDVVDEYTAIIKFSEPNVPFLYGVSTPQLGLVSGPSTELDTQGRCALGGLQGSGPFTVTSYTPMETIELERNDDYNWGSPAWEHQGAAFLDRIVVNISQNASTRAGAAAAGDLDVAHKISETDATLVINGGWENAPDPEPAASAGWVINHDSDIVGADEAVRTALRLGVDREQIVATKPNLFEPARGVLNTAHPFHLDLSDELQYQPDEAARILDEAGWEMGSDGYRSRDGQRLDVEAITYTVGADTNMEIAQAQLAEIGINLTVTPLDSNAQRERWQSGDYDMIVSWNTSAEASVLRSLFQFTNVRDEINEMNAEQVTMADRDERMEFVHEMQEYIIEHSLFIPLWQENVTPFWSPEVHGMAFDVAGIAVYSNVSVEQ